MEEMRMINKMKCNIPMHFRRNTLVDGRARESLGIKNGANLVLDQADVCKIGPAKSAQRHSERSTARRGKF